MTSTVLAIFPPHTDSTVDADRRWDAVLARDAASDGRFVYAVRSTHIYCRPSCPSRRPRRENVAFFPRPDAAEAAGYRACRRCRPNEGAPNELEIVEQLCRELERDGAENADLAALAARVGLPPHRLQRAFKRVTGITPRQYAEACRMRRLRGRLRSGDAITSAMFDTGLSSTSRLYERAPQQLGMTPGAYQRGAPGMRVAFAVVPSPLGKLLVAATARGICAVSLGTSAAELERALAHEFPKAELARDDAALAPWVGVILKHLNGEEPHLDLPLDVRATAFQRRVWQALQEIPYGSTRTYSAIARAIGKPTAARAVARACATNPASVVIPCHRVVREDGALGGYRWGIERKRALLEREAAGRRAGGQRPL
jgi:AraC family transcriptional regulator, regulatory protein of adaptative response / methylated-DNA-[protein]-cysteine methyltransferase